MERLEKYAMEHNIPIMQKDGIDFLCDYIKKNNIKNILEIGSAIGYSAIKMASINKDIKVITIERDIDRYNLACKNIKEYNFNNQIEVILGDALDVEITGKFDLIFIDAAKAQYIKFFLKYEKNLNVGGVIVSDNLNFHGLIDKDPKDMSRNLRGLIKKLNNYILFLKDNKQFKTEFYNIGDGISLSFKIY